VRDGQHVVLERRLEGAALALDVHRLVHRRLGELEGEGILHRDAPRQLERGGLPRAEIPRHAEVLHMRAAQRTARSANNASSAEMMKSQHEANMSPPVWIRLRARP
jgi:hypothetical protein